MIEMDAILKLRGELDHAREQYDLAKFYDSTARMQEEQSYWSKRMTELKAQIAEIEDE